jgi:UDPglucose 6-dehydrogenase
MKITLIGAGYVGLVTGACLAKFGNKVTLLDIDKKKVDLINNKKSPIYEENLDSLLKNYKINATTEYKDVIPKSDLIFICVGTPTKDDNSQDLSYIKSSINELSKYLKQNQIIVIKSSVVPGTTEEIIIPYLEKSTNLKCGKDFFVAVNPEFLKEGCAVSDFLNPDRIVIGSRNDKAKVILNKLYNEFNCPIVNTKIASAEMIKYASNAFLSTKISFINEIGNICKKLDIDVYDVAEGMGYDKRIGRDFLNAGAGWGGSCFPKDVKALINKAKELGVKPRILESVLIVNENQPLKLIELLKVHSKTLKNKEIGILGGAFKPDTDDVRESRTIPVINELLKQDAIVKLYDPQATDNLKKLFPTIKYCTAQEALNADATIVLTKWEEFENLNFSDKIIIDGRKIEKAKKESKIYEGICW